jgi:hypothetical protein
VVLVGGIGLVRHEHRVGGDEPRDVVHVAVRVIAHASLAQPDHPADAEPLGEDALVVGAAHPGIALLHRREQAFLGRQQQAGAVAVDRASFEHDPLDRVGRLHRRVARKTGDPGDVLADLGVVGVVVVLGPRVEAPVDQLRAAGGIVHHGGPRVAGPDAVGGDVVQAHALGRDAVHRELLDRVALHLIAVAEDLDLLGLREHARDLREDPRDGLELAGPVGLVVRPGEPGGPVRLPLGRPAHAGNPRGPGGHRPIQRCRIGP